MRFRYLSISIVWVLVVIYSCNSASAPLTMENTFSIEKDSLPILQLVRAMYQWKFTEQGGDDFPVIGNTTSHQYDQLDTIRFSKRIKEIEASGYFSTGFMQNFSQIGNRLNAELRNKQLSWPVGELAPVGNGANWWCDCQDYPDNFWETLTVQHFASNNHIIKLEVVITEGAKYSMQVIQENNTWKIESMQGLDAASFFPAQ